MYRKKSGELKNNIFRFSKGKFPSVFTYKLDLDMYNNSKIKQGSLLR